MLFVEGYCDDQFRFYGIRIYGFCWWFFGYMDFFHNKLFHLDHFSRDKRGPYIRNWVYCPKIWVYFAVNFTSVACAFVPFVFSFPMFYGRFFACSISMRSVACGALPWNQKFKMMWYSIPSWEKSADLGIKLIFHVNWRKFNLYRVGHEVGNRNTNHF